MVGKNRGITLLEMLIIFAIIGILLVFSAPSLLLIDSTAVNVSGRELGDFLNLCRSEAISQRTSIRLGIVVKSTKPEENFRRYAAWKWDKKTRDFQQYSEWRSLSENVFFSKNLPSKAKASDYAHKEPSAVRGDYILDAVAKGFEQISFESGEKRTLRFLEFSPSGRTRVMWGEKRNLIVSISSGNFASDKTSNWVQFTVDTLTGRTRVYRP
ncbi:MAG: hypothetical protein GXP30_10845 [Verrucomicrobia bacterium]|nr:hypothetical protein [Verrucomicrobiota bacterium]